MKKITTLLIFSLFFSVALRAQNVGIGTTTPNASAKLDVTSTSSGLLIPRMTTVQRNALTPVTSLLIYNTTTDCLEMYSASGAWVSIGCGCQLPGAFSASAATGAISTAFTTNWGASAGATGYFLDVSTSSSFSTFVTGYNNLSVGNVTSFAVSSNLVCGTTYYYRLRANNTCGTSANSNTITAATTGCGVTCGTQIFAAANLNAGTRVDSNITQTAGQKWCYNNLDANCTTWGGLYQWASAMGGSYSNSATTSPTINCDPCTTSSTPVAVQGQCPSGYHVPSDLEWSRYEWCIENTIVPAGTTSLATFQGGAGYRGATTPTGAGPADKMILNSTTITGAFTGDATSNNNSGFTALGSGWYTQTTSAFASKGTFAYFWSATETAAGTADYEEVKNSSSQEFHNAVNKLDGMTIRCMHN